MTVYKYRVWCSTDSKWEYWLLDEGASAPTTCPTDTGHTIDGAKTVIIEKISANPTTPEGYSISAPTFEFDNEQTKNWVGKKLTVTKNVTNIYDSWVEADRSLRGGWFQLLDDPSSPKAVIGDTIEFSIVDKDDVYAPGTFAYLNLTKRINEVQTLTFTGVPTAGTWTITHDGNTTAALQYDASIAEVQAALRALSSLEHVTVSGDYNPDMVLSFLGNDGGIDQPAVTVNDGSLTGATVSVAETTKGVDGDILELTKYLRDYYIAPYDGGKQEFRSDAISVLKAGFFMRVYVHSTGATNDYDLTCVFIEY